MTKEEAAKYLIDISYALGNTSIEHLTEKDGKKMREAVEILKQAEVGKWVKHDSEYGICFSCSSCGYTEQLSKLSNYCPACGVRMWNVIIKKEEQAIEMLKSKMDGHTDTSYEWAETVRMAIKALEQPKVGHCKDCKYFELDSWMNVNGIPLIVAHNICKRWGDGCKTKENGYCFMFESKESEGE